MNCSIYHLATKLVWLTAWYTGYWVVMAAGKEGTVGQGGRGAYSETQGQEAKEKGI